MDPARILVVDDDGPTRLALCELVKHWGFAVESASDGQEALRMAGARPPDLIVSDLVMPSMDGMFLLRALKDELPECVVVLVTGQGSIDLAVQAIQQGAYDFIEKPADPKRLRLVLDRALEKRRTTHEVALLRRNLKRLGPGGSFVGQSAPVRRVFELVEKVAPSKASVVVTGQSGTGKEMVARAIHQLSPRRDGPFVAINSSAIPATLMESEFFGYEKGAFTGADQRRAGCFELADQGTLFLDEIAELPLELQAKLLRVLEDEKVRRLGGKAEICVDVRVLCATHRDLKAEVKAGRFREDLFFRLNVFQIHLVPLRERAEDVPLLVQHFMDRFSTESGKRLRGISPEALRALQSYSWPGNVRELRNAVERAVILAEGDTIGLDHLPPELSSPTGDVDNLKVPLGLSLSEVERSYILASLSRLGGNKARTAHALQISEKTLYNRLREYRQSSDPTNGEESSV